MKLSLTIRAHHDLHGELRLKCEIANMEVCNIDCGFDTFSLYNAHGDRNYITEQAEALEGIYKFLEDVMSYYNGSQSMLDFPEILTRSHLKGAT